MSQFFASGGQSIGVSASASVLPMTIQDWFPLGWTGWISLQSKGLLQHHSSKVSIALLLIYIWFKWHLTVPVRPHRVKGGTNDVSLDVYLKMRKKVAFSPPSVFLIIKHSPLCSRGCTPLPACLYLSQASCANELILHLPLCLMLNSFCTETKEPELQLRPDTK